MKITDLQKHGLMIDKNAQNEITEIIANIKAKEFEDIIQIHKLENDGLLPVYKLKDIINLIEKEKFEEFYEYFCQIYNYKDKITNKFILDLIKYIKKPEYVYNKQYIYEAYILIKYKIKG